MAKIKFLLSLIRAAPVSSKSARLLSQSHSLTPSPQLYTCRSLLRMSGFSFPLSRTPSLAAGEISVLATGSSELY